MDDKIFTIPKKLVHEYGTRDPFQIARLRSYEVRFLDLKRQKGFCKNIYNNIFIFINDNMSDQMKRMTCGHELGHIFIHPQELRRRKQFIEMELFDIKDTKEYEANLFAAYLLIDVNELKKLLYAGYDIVAIASTLNVNVNMLAVMLAELSKQGLPINVPFIPDHKFLGRIEDRADSF